MQTLTIASQQSVEPTQMGVATSASTFFRQIGGTLGVAILLSVLFTLLPTNITGALQNKSDLTAGLNAALTPSVADAPNNKGVMDQIWNKIVDPIKENAQKGLDAGSAKAIAAADAAVTTQVTAAVQQQVAAGHLPAAAEQTAIDQGVAAAKPQAEAAALDAVAKAANGTVQDGKVVIDWSDATARGKVVDKAVPTIIDKVKTLKAKGSTSSDTSFLNGADKRLTTPFLKGFNASVVVVYWVAMFVLLLAFVITWFFRVPVLRTTSALQERANAAGATGVSATGTIQTQDA
jgi:hypothetical protein